MKKIILIFLLYPIIALAGQNDFSFYSTGKTHTYTISEMSKQISEQYGFTYKLFAIVVASETTSDRYKKQFEYLYKLDGENLGLIYISALSDRANTDGYHTDENVANEILDGRNFLVTIFSPKGELLYRSETVLTNIEIETIVKKYNK